MADHIEALERLQKLREAGALTEAEFELEKVRLLAVPPEAPQAAPRGRLAWIAGGIAAALLVALLIVLLLRRVAVDGNEVATANQTASPANLATPAPPAETGIRARPPREQLAAAFRTAFGRATRASRTVEGGTVTYTPGGLRWFGDRAVLVSSGTNSQDCHACSGFIAVHYLEAADEGFRVSGEWLTRIQSGGFGQPSDWRFSALLSDQPMIEISGGGMWQGIVCSSQSYYDLGPSGPREVAGFLTGMDTSGSGIVDARSLEGCVRNVVKDQSFDVIYSGSERFTEHYEMRGGRYVLTTSAESRAIC